MVPKSQMEEPREAVMVFNTSVLQEQPREYQISIALFAFMPFPSNYSKTDRKFKERQRGRLGCATSEWGRQWERYWGLSHLVDALSLLSIKRAQSKRNQSPRKLFPLLTRVLVLSAHPHLYKSYIPLPFGLSFPPFSPLQLLLPLLTHNFNFLGLYTSVPNFHHSESIIG